MSLLNQWEELATSFNNDPQMQQKFWTNYYLQEKDIYAQLLENPTVLEGTVQELADKFEMDLVLFGGGFLVLAATNYLQYKGEKKAEDPKSEPSDSLNFK